MPHFRRRYALCAVAATYCHADAAAATSAFATDTLFMITPLFDFLSSFLVIF